MFYSHEGEFKTPPLALSPADLDSFDEPQVWCCDGLVSLATRTRYDDAFSLAVFLPIVVSIADSSPNLGWWPL